MNSKRLEQYLSGEVDPNEEAAIAAHVESCPCCKDWLDFKIRDAENDPLLNRLSNLGSDQEISEPDFPDSLMKNRPRPSGEDAYERIILPGPYPETSPLGQLGKYLIKEEIGHGGFGVVYAAQEAGTERWVAVKVLYPWKELNDDPHNLLLKEARYNNSVNWRHDNVVQIYEVRKESGFSFLVMELVDGGRLSATRPQRLQIGTEPCASDVTQAKTAAANAVHGQCSDHRPQDSQQWSLREISTIFVQIADALDVLRQVGVLHRDIKPANILIEARNGRPKITDFGMAAKAGEYGRGCTPAYSSPEQLGGAEVDHRSDIYSTGVVLYELLTGNRPFQQVEDHRKAASGERRPSRREHISDAIRRGDLEAIALKCIRSEPTKRYKTAAELKADLQRWLNCEPVHATAARKWWRGCLWIIRNRWWIAIFLPLLFAAVIFAERTFSVGHARDIAEAEELVANRALSTCEITVSRMAMAPGTVSLRRELLSNLLPIRESRLKRYRDRPELQVEAADASFRLAHIEAVLGKVDAAKAHFSDANRFFMDLQKRGPRNQKEKVLLVAYLNDRVLVSKLLGIASDADEASYRASVQYARELVESSQPPQDAEALLALSLLNHGAWLVDQSRFARACEVLKEALQRLQRYVPPSEVQRHAWAATMANLAKAELAAGASLELQEDRINSAIDTWKTLLKNSPQAPPYLEGLAKTIYRLGELQEKNGRLDDARNSFVTSQGMLKTLSDQAPLVGEYRLMLARVSQRLWLLAQGNDAYDAAKTAILAIEGLPTAEQERPEVRQLLIDAHWFRVHWFGLHFDYDPHHNAKAAQDVERLQRLGVKTAFLPKNLKTLAIYLARSHDHRRAAQLAGEVLSDGESDGELLYDLACVFSRCAEATEFDVAIAPTQHSDLADRYARRALQLLGKPETLAKLRKITENILDEDPDLQWLRVNRAAAIDSLRDPTAENTESEAPESESDK